ncbi:MAG: beta-ketoacyl synthase N-terminal-like domain-containing protein [Thermodesulfovibrionia bacterium]|nr:beta-ketoacyl synthase N-terminal-like domain-containing protein [Thermodesulfovibrionia bacterium]
MNILGIGIVFNRGRGINCFENALQEGWQGPAEVEVPYLKNKKSFVYQVDSQTISDKTLLRKMRRSDKLSKMAVLSASDALKSSGIENLSPSPNPSSRHIGREGEKIGVIVATAFGAHVKTFDFLDDILDYGEDSVSPTTFSNSVHNAAASYVSSTLDIHGPTLTVTQFYFSFQYAMQLARAWLNEKRCDYILVGAVEQYGDVLGYVYDCKLTPAPDGRIKPFNFNPTFQVPGEGAVFFLMGRENSENSFCEVENIMIGEYREFKTGVDLNIIDTDGMLPDESVYMQSISPDIHTAAYSPLFGSMMTGSAFNCAAGALMLKNQKYYANPVLDNPHGINILIGNNPPISKGGMGGFSEQTKRSDIELIRCIRYSCHSEKAAIYLRKNH